MSSPSQLSFLPDDYLERKARRRTNVICAVLFVVVMGGIGSAFAISERAVRNQQAQHARVEQQYADAARRIEQVRQMQEKQKRMARQAELTASLLEKVPRSYLLAELTNSMPAGVSLLDFVMESKVKTAPPPAPGSAAAAQAKTAYEQKKAEIESRKSGAPAATPGAGEPKQYVVTMKLTGLAMTDVQVAQFLNKLSRSRLLNEVNLLISDEFQQQDQKMRKFQIEMTLNPSAQVHPQDRANKTAAVELETR